MKWAWKIGRMAGIEVYLHATFLILLGWVALEYYFLRRSWADALEGVLFICAVFGVVVLHELGHALMARRFGVKTRDITLWPIGGVARLEKIPEDPRQELLVALAGPAVNLIVAVVLLVLLVPMQAFARFFETFLVPGAFLVNLVIVNFWLAFFNLLPAFPMDGGRVLRALLALRIDYVRATEIAARVGQGIALLLGAVGLFKNPLLVFIALFVWMGASAEAGMVQVKHAVANIPIIRIMVKEFKTLSPNDTLAKAVEYIMAGFQQDFPVVVDGKVVGILTRADLIRGLSKYGLSGLVGDVMRTDFLIVEPFDLAEIVFNRLQECECHTVPVVYGGQLVGLVTSDNIGEFLMIHSALSKNAPPVIKQHSF
jgi:Zn-dependent protease